MLWCFLNVAIISDDFKVTGVQTLGAGTDKARLHKLSLVLGTISCEIDDISYLRIFEKRLAELGGCRVDRARYVRVDSLHLIR